MLEKLREQRVADEEHAADCRGLRALDHRDRNSPKRNRLIPKRPQENLQVRDQMGLVRALAQGLGLGVFLRRAGVEVGVEDRARRVQSNSSRPGNLAGHYNLLSGFQANRQGPTFTV